MKILKEDLQILSGMVVVESDFIPKKERKDLLNYIQKEANEHELMSFILDGSIPKTITEESKTVIEDRFYALESDKFLQDILNEFDSYKAGHAVGKAVAPVARPISKGLGVAGKAVGNEISRTANFWVKNPLKKAAGGLLALWVVYRGIKALFNQKSRRCGVFGFGKARQQCMAQVQMEIAKKELDVLNKMRAECKNQANPQACQQQIQNKINKANETLSKATNNANKLALKGKVKTPAAGTYGTKLV